MASQRAYRPQVLIVEDDTPVRRSLQLLLAARGYAVRAYANASLALADPAAWQSDCLIADLVMDEIDGVGLLASLRAKGWDGTAILISGHLDGERTRHAEEAGFETILQKPFADGLLLDAVARAVDDA